jgi:hypothetical protein
VSIKEGIFKERHATLAVVRFGTSTTFRMEPAMLRLINASI